MNSPCCCYICSPCVTGCPEEMCCRAIPPCNTFVDPVHPNDTNIYKSPMCNKKLIAKGPKCGSFMFCSNRQSMKYYTCD